MQLAKQQAETEEFMKAPFEPEESAPSLAGPGRPSRTPRLLEVGKSMMWSSAMVVTATEEWEPL